MISIIALKETIKELARTIWFIFVASVATYIQNQIIDSSVSTETSILVGTLILKLIDRYIHKNPKIEVNGIAPPFLQR